MAVLSIQSHVSAGHVGNAVAVPALQFLGRDVWPVHTVLFSNHPGHGAFQGGAVPPDLVAACLRGLADHAAWPAREAVLSGYLGQPGTAEAVAEVVDAARADRAALPYLCDPVMGDTGPGLYVDDAIPEAMRRLLIPRATIATPNRFELEVLTGRPCPDLAATVEAARTLSALGPPVVVVTSVDAPDGPEPSAARCLVTAGGAAWVVASPRLRFPQAPNGAGDLLAALFLHHWLLDPRPQVALSAAVSGLFAVLEATVPTGGRELALLAGRAAMAEPARVWGPIRL
ncbi:pyridoxal kinase [Roseospira navarrensis]|uniref:pyridoxal kinase n=1 Tax=Roseospira navarrensis TaxID=140058 RepID=A0A7X1ZD31_9PROT|nr:pyridoxal kinase [Roseospira navarrensis]MQX35809.1 pyridoxal kinase [Roseospira navarrensis]